MRFLIADLVQSSVRAQYAETMSIASLELGPWL